MDDLEEKKRSQAKWVGLIAVIGASIWYLDVLSSYPTRFDDTGIGGSIMVIIFSLAFVVFVSPRFPIGKAVFQVLPEMRVYVATFFLLAVVGAIFRIMATEGVEPLLMLVVLAVVLSCGYLAALLPRSADFLSTHGYPRKGLHAMFLCVLSLTLISFILRLL